MYFWRTWKTVVGQCSRSTFSVASGKKLYYLLSLWILTTRWCYSQGKYVLANKSPILRRTFNRWYRPDPFLSLFFFSANAQNVTNLFFQTLPRQFHGYAPNFAHSIFGLSLTEWRERKSWFNTIPKLGINNFLTKIAKIVSVAYLHIGVSDWHETWVDTATHSLRLCVKFGDMTTGWRSYASRFLYLNISLVD